MQLQYDAGDDDFMYIFFFVKCVDLLMFMYIAVKIILSGDLPNHE